MDTRQCSKEDKEKFLIDSNDDFYRHWLTYPQPPTPSHIVDAKQRLGQEKLARPTTALNASGERQKQISQSSEHLESSVSHRRSKKSDDKRHFLDFNLPPTPPELRAARHRLEKHRYHPSLDNYPPCSQPYLEDIDDFSTPPVVPESEGKQFPSEQTKDEAVGTDDENKIIDNEPSSISIQTGDVEGLPNEYVEALQISDAAQEEYYNNLKLYGDQQADNSVYRVPSISAGNQQDSFVS